MHLGHSVPHCSAHGALGTLVLSSYTNITSFPLVNNSYTCLMAYACYLFWWTHYSWLDHAIGPLRLFWCLQKLNNVRSDIFTYWANSIVACLTQAKVIWEEGISPEKLSSWVWPAGKPVDDWHGRVKSILGRGGRHSWAGAPGTWESPKEQASMQCSSKVSSGPASMSLPQVPALFSLYEGW